MASNVFDNGASTIYCHQVAKIEKLGPNRLLVFTMPSLNDPSFEEVQIRIVLPAEAMNALAHMAIDIDGTVSSELLALVPGVANCGMNKGNQCLFDKGNVVSLSTLMPQANSEDEGLLSEGSFATLHQF
jgi:hypothetical protein